MTPTTQSGRKGSLLDPAALMRIKNMELRSRVIVEGFMTGLHRSPYHGFSVEFTEYREYVPGDDTKHVDWQLFARSDRYYIKKYEDETNLRCTLLVDHSKSMGFSSLEYDKAGYAGTLAATFAHFLFRQGDAVGLMTFDEKIDNYLPTRNRPGHLRNVMLALDKLPAGTATDLSGCVERAASMLTKRGLLVLISDLLAPLEELERQLGLLRAVGHEVVVFHVLDPAELKLDFDEPALFVDIESNRELFIDPGAAREKYKKKLDAHLAAAEALCGRQGIDYFHFSTERPFELALFDFLSARTKVSAAANRRNR